jgi:hypothetical protein
LALLLTVCGTSSIANGIDKKRLHRNVQIGQHRDRLVRWRAALIDNGVTPDLKRLHESEETKRHPYRWEITAPISDHRRRQTDPGHHQRRFRTPTHAMTSVLMGR